MKNRSLITGFISALCLTSSCCLFGSENSDNDIDSILSSSPTTNQPKVIFPSGGYRAEEGADAFITADFLYWEARQEGLSYAMTGVSRASSGSTRLPQGNIFYPEFKYDPGFRVGLGIGLGHDAWSLSVQYTWYHQNFHPASVSHPNNSIAQLTSTESNVYTTLPPTPPFTYAKGEWKLMLNMIDGELGRDSYVSKYLAIDTFYGLKAVWQNQNFNTIYQWNDDNNRNTPTQNNIYQSAKSFGIGLRAGSHTDWSFNRNWSLFGDFAANVLSTRSHILA
ncbi:MAG: hypothetical protein K9M13_03280, partial [Simkaniaceae bacterium]|nr:hypothetical protein [Simkaniaceae bacterium]